MPAEVQLESPERTERLERLQKLEPQVNDMKNVLYNEAELDELNVSIEPFTLHENGEPNFKPCFFKPFMGKLEEDDPYVEELAEDVLEWEPYNEEDEELPIDWAQSTYEYWMDYNFAQMFEFKKRTGSEMPEIGCNSVKNYGLRLIEHDPVLWYAWGAGHFEDFPKRPHFLCIMATDINGENDKITRGELLCILRMQVKFHQVPFLSKHIIYPILLLSFMGPRHVRMLQAHYDGSKLVIRKTELYDFTKERNVKALTLFTRWSSSFGIGNTRAE